MTIERSVVPSVELALVVHNEDHVGANGLFLKIVTNGAISMADDL